MKALALGLSAPVAYRLIEQATAAPTGAPQRFMLFFMPHGVPPEHYNPVGDAENFSLIDSGVSILGPLDPYKSLVNIYQGFTYPGANTHEGITKFLSNTDFADSDDTTPRTSIEHYIGSELGTGTLALGAVPHREWGQDLDAKLMWDGQPVVPQKNPLVAYDEVFGGLAMGDAPAAPPAANDELYEALLTLTERDIEGLSQSLSGMTGEQSKLAIHLDSIKALRSNGGGGISCDTAPTLAALDALRAKASGQADKWFLTEENFPDIFAAQLEIAAAAMVCNARSILPC